MVGKIIGFQEFRDSDTKALYGYTLHVICPFGDNGVGFRPYSCFVPIRILNRFDYTLEVNKEIDFDFFRTDKGSYRCTYISDSV